MTKVLVFGAFDFVHPGHIDFFKQAKKFGDIIVVVATDRNFERVKGEKPKFSQTQRQETIASLNIVDRAFVGYETDVYRIIDEIKPDVICLGYDQETFVDQLEERFPEIDIKRMNPFKENEYKSSKLKHKYEGHIFQQD